LIKGGRVADVDLSGMMHVWAGTDTWCGRVAGRPRSCLSRGRLRPGPSRQHELSPLGVHPRRWLGAGAAVAARVRPSRRSPTRRRDGWRLRYPRLAGRRHGAPRQRRLDPKEAYSAICSTARHSLDSTEGLRPGRAARL